MLVIKSPTQVSNDTGKLNYSYPGSNKITTILSLDLWNVRLSGDCLTRLIDVLAQYVVYDLVNYSLE